MDEIRLRRSFPTGAHVACDLAAMVSRVHYNMRQHLHNGAHPQLSLAIFVRDRLREVTGFPEIAGPQPAQFGSFRLATLELQLRCGSSAALPDWPTDRRQIAVANGRQLPGSVPPLKIALAVIGRSTL